MAYSNVTPPAMPAYDAAAYPYRITSFNYGIDEEDWYEVHIWYSAVPFTFNGSCVVGGVTVYTQICNEAGDWTSPQESNPEVKPGENGNVYQRIGTNHDILDDEGNVWLAANTVTEVTEEPVEPQTGFDSISHQIGFGLGMSLIGRRIANIIRMCLYGGTEILPGPPSWDRSKFPYVAVFKYADCDYKEADYKFVGSTAPYLLSTTGDSIVTATQVRRRFWISDDRSHWIDKGEVEQEVEMYLRILELFDGHTVVWTNHDILHVDSDDVYMAASNPTLIVE